jgi:Tfp pilus assembly protein PilF
MAGKRTFKTQSSKLQTTKSHSFTPHAYCFTLLVCTLLLFGCVPPDESEKIQSPPLNKVTKTPIEEKKQKLKRAIERRFENPDAHFELGQIYQIEGSRIAAEYHYNTALRFDPVHRDAQAAMVKMLIDSGDKAKARVTADNYMMQVSTSAKGSLRLGLGFQKQGLDEYTLACYQQALRLEPNSAETYKQFGLYYLSKNDKVRAREYLTRSFQLDPTQPDVALQLGHLGVEIKIPEKPETTTKTPGKTVGQTE